MVQVELKHWSSLLICAYRVRAALKNSKFFLHANAGTLSSAAERAAYVPPTEYAAVNVSASMDLTAAVPNVLMPLTKFRRIEQGSECTLIEDVPLGKHIIVVEGAAMNPKSTVAISYVITW